MSGQGAVDTNEVRIARASQAIRSMSDDLGAELDEANYVAPPVLQRLRTFTRDAPLPALGIAFLLGVILTRH